MPLATVDAVQALLLRNLTEVEALHYPALEAMADATVSAYLPGVALAAGDDTVTVRADNGRVWLPWRPVSAVTAVSVGGATLAPSAYTWHSDGRLDLVHNPWAADVEVTFAYGPAPAELATVAAQLIAARLSQPALGVKQQSESVGPFSQSVSYDSGGAGPMSLTADQQRLLARYRRRNATVVHVYGDQVRYGFRRGGYPDPVVGNT